MLRLTTIIFLFLLAVSPVAQAQTVPEPDTIFAKGNQVTSENYQGDVWISELFLKPGYLVANLTFGPGARNNWHRHPGAEQLMLVTSGTGYCQLEGQPVQLLQKGDILNIPAGAVHWQGAAADSYFVHLTITDEVGGSHVEWLRAVSDAEYQQAGQ